MQAAERAQETSNILKRPDLEEKPYYLATVHRAENTEARLRGTFDAFAEIGEPIVLPLHPRKRAALERNNISPSNNVQIIEPIGYLDMAFLEKSAKGILTDSGGVQKEAYRLGVPCVTMRDETEWVETVDAGWNVIVGADTQKIVEAAVDVRHPAEHPSLYGEGNAVDTIIDLICRT